MAKKEREGTAEVQGVHLYYRREGAGEAVILIAGLGANTELWMRQVAALSGRYEVVTFDNRGSGRSEVPEGPYSVKTMAADTVQLLDALDIPAAHVVGDSLGAMIAQEVAIQYPDKALSLVLMGGQTGGIHAFCPPPEELEALERLATAEMNPLQRAQGWLPHIFSERFLADEDDLVREYVDAASKQPTETAGLKAQWAALTTYDSWEGLPSVAAPTLVLQGTDDRIVPAENADVLCVRIPDSRVVLIEGAGHTIAFEAADTVNDLLSSFFGENRYFD